MPSDSASPAAGCTWHLLRHDNGTWTHLDTFYSPEGQECWGCDMHAWMMEQGHYSDGYMDQYDWEGDSESVAIMPKKEGMPEFTFVWRDAADKSPNPY